jgi:hypothetical protein
MKAQLDKLVEEARSFINEGQCEHYRVTLVEHLGGQRFGFKLCHNNARYKMQAREGGATATVCGTHRNVLKQQWGWWDV